MAEQLFVMDFEDRNEIEEGLPKWPFFFSALFIFSGAIGFAYFHFHTNGTLEVWQLLVCILASGIGSLLIFLPFLLERSLQLYLLKSNRKDDELFRKVYFDLKEVRNDLESLAVRIDKVPTLVDKIVSESVNEINPSEEISNELKKLQNEIELKLARLEELAVQEPIPNDTDPAIVKSIESLSNLEKKVQNLSQKTEIILDLIEKIPTEFPELQPDKFQREQASDVLESENPNPDEIKEPEEIEIKGILHEDAFSPDLVDQSKGEIEEDGELLLRDIDQEDSLVSEIIDPVDELVAIDSNETQGVIVEDNENESLSPSAEKEPNDILEDLEPPLEETTVNEEGLEQQVTLKSEELDLDLPDPEETIRKVDALLSEKQTDKEIPNKENKEKKNSTNTGMTSVIANVMIGIGNKPFVRGEGPGLSWDEGVSMNFIEIGKWAWSPPRKNAPLTIQIYRNDEDPDKGGKYEIKPGEKFELTPEF